MREIKFRAWSESDGGVMLQPGDLYGTRTPLDCCQYVNQGQPITLEQYTGKKDSQGIEIYEGDVCLGVHMKALPVKCEWNSSQHRWSWYTLGNDDIYCHLGEGHGDPEVVGTIHQYPELLKD